MNPEKKWDGFAFSVHCILNLIKISVFSLKRTSTHKTDIKNKVEVNVQKVGKKMCLLFQRIHGNHAWCIGIHWYTDCLNSIKKFAFIHGIHFKMEILMKYSMNRENQFSNKLNESF